MCHDSHLDDVAHKQDRDSSSDRAERRVHREAHAVPLPAVYAIFVLSGFAALIYQVVWQRSLFSLYGIDADSVTIVVTAFLLGLGIGSHLGGRLSRDPSRPVLLTFAGLELGIAVYGAISLSLFRWVGCKTAGSSGLVTFGASFALVLLPTAAMGATLPLLVAYSVRRSGNVGRSVGMLYFVNTLGSALAAIVTALLLLRHLGQQAAVAVASVCNALVALSAGKLWLGERGRTGSGGP